MPDGALSAPLDRGCVQGSMRAGYTAQEPSSSAKAATSLSDGDEPSRFFLEALREAARRRSEGASSSAPPSPPISTATPSSASTAVPAQQLPAPPQGPPPATARPRSAMAALAGAAAAKASAAVKKPSPALDAQPVSSAAWPESQPRSAMPQAQNADAVSAEANVVRRKFCDRLCADLAASHDSLIPKARADKKALVQRDTDAGASGSVAKETFVDPRLERMHFLQAVQRMRAQVSSQEQETSHHVVDKVRDASLTAGRPLRPQSALARLQEAAGEPGLRHRPRQDIPANVDEAVEVLEDLNSEEIEHTCVTPRR